MLWSTQLFQFSIDEFDLQRDRREWMRERTKDQEFPFYRQELPWRLPLFSLSDFGQRETRDRKTGERERERERERNSKLWYQEFPWTWTRSLFVTIKRFRSLFITINTYQTNTYTSRRDYWDTQRDMKKRGREREREIEWERERDSQHECRRLSIIVTIERERKGDRESEMCNIYTYMLIHSEREIIMKIETMLTYAACWPSALKYCIKYSTRVYNVYVNILYSNINILRTRLPMSLHPSLPTHKFINSEKTHNHQTWSRTCVAVAFHCTRCGFFSSPTDCKNAPAVSIAKVSTVSSLCLGALSPRKKSRLCPSTCRL